MSGATHQLKLDSPLGISSRKVKHMLTKKRETSTTLHEVSNYVPARVLEIELGQPLLPLSAFDEKTGHYYKRALCLIRLHTQPLGVIELQLDEPETSVYTYAQH